MGFFEKIKAGLTRTKENIGHSFDQLFAGELNDDFYDELEETLILGDMGVETTMKAVEELRRRVKAEKIKDMEGARACLRRVLTDMLQVGEPELRLDTAPSVALFIGVNGVGKTTTIGKLAARMKGEGRRVLMAAADTFRAAAADQLEIWSERSGVELVRQYEGADPAAVVFDALSAAKARSADVVLIDTAGRLHNKQNLMNELNKIQPRRGPGAARLRPGDPAGAGRHHRTERPDPGQAVQGGRGHHRHRPDQAGRLGQGRHCHCHRPGAPGAGEIHRRGGGHRRPDAF